MKGVQKALGGGQHICRNSNMEVLALQDTLLSFEKENTKTKKEQKGARRPSLGPSHSLQCYASLIKTRKQMGYTSNLLVIMDGGNAENTKGKLEEVGYCGVRFNDALVWK